MSKFSNLNHFNSEFLCEDWNFVTRKYDKTKLGTKGQGMHGGELMNKQ